MEAQGSQLLTSGSQYNKTLVLCKNHKFSYIQEKTVLISWVQKI